MECSVADVQRLFDTVVGAALFVPMGWMVLAIVWHAVRPRGKA